MNNIKINCLKWGTKYNSDYVNRTYGGLLKHCQVPFHFVCYTDDAKGISSKIETKNIKELSPYNTKKVFTYQKLFIIENSINIYYEHWNIDVIDVYYKNLTLQTNKIV